MKIKIISVTLLLLTVFALPAGAYSSLVQSDYIYSDSLDDVSIPCAYVVKSVNKVDVKLPEDMSVTSDGSIFIADTGSNRIAVYNSSFVFQKALTSFTASDGTVTGLNAPEGVFVSDESIYIADTGNNRILKCDLDGKILLEIFKPDGMVGLEEERIFYPTKVSADSSGRIYAVARNINMGIIGLDENGDFLSYMGAPRVQPDFLELVWRRFSTKAQKAQMSSYVSTEYNNVVLDGENFIWGTISSLDTNDIKNTIASRDKSGSVTPVAKINAADIDILKRNGLCAPLGDLKFKEEQSRIIDVAPSGNGIYSLLDYNMGRVFTYDDNGNLLFVFGEKGNKKGSLKTPSAIAYHGSSIMVLDKELSEIIVYEPTAYGIQVRNAVASQYSGDYQTAYELWGQIAKQNANFEYAFVGLGNVYMSADDYSSAMKYYKYASDEEKYSEAFELMRKQIISKYFIWFFVFIGAVFLILIIHKAVRAAQAYIRG